MYKIVFSDLDETLLIGNHVPEFNLKAIQEAKRRGVKFVPCTGRGQDMVGELLEELGMTGKRDEYMVGYNGALVCNCESFEPLFFQGLSYELCEKIRDFGLPYDVCFMVFTLEGCHFFRPNINEVKRKEGQHARHFELELDQFEILKDKHICKFLFMNYDEDYLLKIKEQVPSDILECTEITTSSQRYLEFNAAGVSKGNGLAFLCDYLGIDLDEAIAIGDNYNDTSMILKAGLGVAVQCAKKDIQALADYVTVKDFDEGAVQEVIEKFILDCK